MPQPDAVEKERANRLRAALDMIAAGTVCPEAFPDLEGPALDAASFLLIARAAVEVDDGRSHEGESVTSEEHLLNLLSIARWYVTQFEPRTAEEDFDMNALIGEIDNVLPSPEPSPPLCGERYCCRPKGHEGAHDDIPF